MTAMFTKWIVIAVVYFQVEKVVLIWACPATEGLGRFRSFADVKYSK